MTVRTRVDVEVVVEAGPWETVAGAEERSSRAALAAWEAADHPPPVAGRPAEISIVLADDALVRRLNRDYRSKDAATNVLSFALLDDAESGMQEPDGTPILLGDVILAHETVAREAREQGKPFDHHMTHLVVHGVLHLLGYDHDTDEDAERMERLEARILAGLGLSDPYADRARVEPRTE